MEVGVGTDRWILCSRELQIFHARTVYFVLAVNIFKKKKEKEKRLFGETFSEDRIWALSYQVFWGKNPFQLQKLKLILYRNCVDNFSVTCIRPTYIIKPFKPSVP